MQKINQTDKELVFLQYQTSFYQQKQVCFMLK
jgi:hypothetical protein